MASGATPKDLGVTSVPLPAPHCPPTPWSIPKICPPHLHGVLIVRGGPEVHLSLVLQAGVIPRAVPGWRIPLGLSGGRKTDHCHLLGETGACPWMIPSAGTSGFHQPSEFLTCGIPGLALHLKVSKLEKVKTKQEELKNGNLHRFLPGWHCRIKGCSSPGWDSRWEHPSREAGRAQPPPRLPWLSSSHPKTSKQYNSPVPAPLVGIPGV